MQSDRMLQLQAFLKENPSDDFIKFAIAKEYEKSNDFQNAIAHFESLLEDNENYSGAYYHLGKLYIKIGDNEKALNIYNKGLTITKTIGEDHDHRELMGAKQELEW